MHRILNANLLMYTNTLTIFSSSCLMGSLSPETVNCGYMLNYVHKNHHLFLSKLAVNRRTWVHLQYCVCIPFASSGELFSTHKGGWVIYRKRFVTYIHVCVFHQHLSSKARASCRYNSRIKFQRPHAEMQQTWYSDSQAVCSACVALSTLSAKRRPCIWLWSWPCCDLWPGFRPKAKFSKPQPSCKYGTSIPLYTNCLPNKQ